MLGELNMEEIEELLRTSLVGRIGCSDGERTYIVPISYIYENNSLLCHSRDGLKITMMRRNPAVCFQVDEIRSYDHWRSVIAWGTYEELTEEKDIEHAQQHFSDYLLQMKTTASALPPESQEERFHNIKPEFIPTIFYRIRLTEASGRYEQAL